MGITGIIMKIESIQWKNAFKCHATSYLVLRTVKGMVMVPAKSLDDTPVMNDSEEVGFG